MGAPKVLVVDDEPSVLHLVSTALSARGYEVHAVASPTKALELVRATPCFDLVVSDVIMPEMCGPELVRKLSRICPTTAFVLMSAHLDVSLLPEHAAFISKPFRLKDLYSVVEQKLSVSRDDSNHPAML